MLTTKTFAKEPKWIKLADEKDGNVVIDVNNIVTHGSLIRVWSIFNYNTIKYYNALSFKQTFEIDCKEVTVKSYSGTFYRDRMAEGDVVFSDERISDFSPVPPGTAIDKIKEHVCPVN
jgi:hypothetical protein